MHKMGIRPSIPKLTQLICICVSIACFIQKHHTETYLQKLRSAALLIPYPAILKNFSAKCKSSDLQIHRDFGVQDTHRSERPMIFSWVFRGYFYSIIAPDLWIGAKNLLDRLLRMK